MATPSDVGAQIKRRRQQLRMSQAELARRTDVTPTTVSNWENGKHFPAKRWYLVEEVLGITLGDHAEPDPAETALRATGRFTEAEIQAMVAAKRALQPPAPPPNPGEELIPAT